MGLKQPNFSGPVTSFGYTAQRHKAHQSNCSGLEAMQ